MHQDAVSCIYKKHYDYRLVTNFLGAFIFSLYFNFLYFGVIFNKTIIPLSPIGYEMIIFSQLDAMHLISYIVLPLIPNAWLRKNHKK